jgi:hypothetical protein
MRPDVGKSLPAVRTTELPEIATELLVILPLEERSSNPRPLTHSAIAGASNDSSQVSGYIR